MDREESVDLLRFLWAETSGGRSFTSADGREISIISAGERMDDGCFSGATVETDGMKMHGDVVFGPEARHNRYTVLHVTATEQPHLTGFDGNRIPQIVIPIPPEVARCAANLRGDGSRTNCASYLTSADPIRRVRLLEQLSLENLRRKAGEIESVLDSTGSDWHQTLLVMLFKAMGGNQNREQYMKLASIVTYHTILRERSSVMMVEALLLGTSGLLEGCYYDDYIKSLKQHYAYLQNKYAISPMRADEWEQGRNRPADKLIIRMVQLATLLADNDFLFDRVVSCSSREDIHNLFKAEASDYWTSHYRPDARGTAFPKRLGSTKSDLLGINLVIPMMFTYGGRTGKEALKERAVALYEAIPPESNSVLRPWTGHDVPLANAQDSQALLQLNKVYCAEQRCACCPIGKAIIRRNIPPEALLRGIR